MRCVVLNSYISSLAILERKIRQTVSGRKIRMRILVYFSCFVFKIGSVAGHGKLVDPPGRNTVMNTQRLHGFTKKCSTGEINYSDTSNFCGGTNTQAENDGKCSACGDDWAATYPRKHDAGGDFAKQVTPVRAYLQGQVITVKVEITASHEGYFEFRLCPKLEGEEGDDDLTKCYQDPAQYRLLQLTDGKTRAHGISHRMTYTYDLHLPADINCDKGCNFQWWYRTGNSWGCDPDQTCGTGKGQQEHFVNCADILILTCAQYKSGKYPDWCGYGPTEELKSCTIEDATDEGVSTTDSESSEFDAETGFDPAVESGLEPGPGEATSAGEGAGVGPNQGLEPINADKGTNTQPAHPFLRVCYYSNWSQYRNGDGKFFPENIDPYLCTHLIYSFAKLTNNKLATYEWNDDDLYKRFNQLKETNPDLKTLLAVGGWNFGSPPFSRLAASSSLRQQFASTSVQFLRANGFDGLDMDWEYPALRGGGSEDKENFVLLLQDMKEAFEAEHTQTGNPQLLLTAAVAAGRTNIEAAYDIPGMNKYLDFINLMSYDLHGAWEKFTGHNAPLQEDDKTEELNVDWAARYWRDNGTPEDKLIIGLATYGRTFTLANPSDNGIGAPARGAGSAGQKTREAGFMAYYEVCEKLSRNEGVKHWDAERQVPYLVVGNQWIGYDDEFSFAAKLRYIRDNNYGGAMVWNIDLDDFQQSCSLSTRPYPLMSLMSEILNSPAGEPTYNTSSGSTENKPSGSLSLESEEEWSSSNGAANSDNDQGNTETTENGGEELAPINGNDNADTNNRTENNVENIKPTINGINNDNILNNDQMKNDSVNTVDQNNNENGGDHSGTLNNDKDTHNELSPMHHGDAPDVGETVSCETCYREGLPYCDACCEIIMTSEIKGNRPMYDNWCQAVCNMGFCPQSHCRKYEMKSFRQSCDIPSFPDIPGTGSLSTLPSCEECQRQGSPTCPNKCCEKWVTTKVKGKSARFQGWCEDNCALGNCPSSHCIQEEKEEWRDVCMAALRSLGEVLRDHRRS